MFSHELLSVTSTQIIYFECPHCGGMCEVIQKDINCGIFRHAVHADTFLPFDPHASESSMRQSKVHGCGKPFKFINGIVSKCGYV